MGNPPYEDTLMASVPTCYYFLRTSGQYFYPSLTFLVTSLDEHITGFVYILPLGLLSIYLAAQIFIHYTHSSPHEMRKIRDRALSDGNSFLFPFELVSRNHLFLLVLFKVYEEPFFINIFLAKGLYVVVELLRDLF